MKSICIVLVSLTILCPLVAEAKPTHLEPSVESYQELLQRSLSLETCAEAFRDDLRPIAEDFGGWVEDVLDRMVRIIELRRSCNEIEMSDPPTRWELIQREACELRFQGAIALEMARLNYEIVQKLQTYPAILRESVRSFLECAINELPESSEYHEMIVSMHRN